MIVEQSLWPVRRLEELIVDMQPGFAQRPRPDKNGVPQLRTNNISNAGEIDLTEIKYVRPSQSELEKYSVRRGDVIFNNTNSPELVGRAAYFDLDAQFVLSNHMTRIRVNPNLLDAEYLAKYLHYLWQIGASLKWAKQWVNQAAIDQNGLARFPIPLPPLPEQRRIVAILRKADELRRLRQRANQRARDLLPALFEQIKTRALKWATIESVTQRCNKTDPAQLPTSNFLYIDISSIDNQTGRITDFRRLATTDAPSRARQAVQKGDVLVSSVRPNLQNNAIIENEPNLPLIASTGFVVLRANGRQVTSGYLYLIVRTEWFSQQLVRKVQGAAYPAVTEHDVLSIKIPLPDHQLLLLVDEMVQKYLLINNQSQRFGERITQLRDSLLARAFTGELTAAWREAHAEELRAAAAARDRLLAQRQKPEKISVEITGDFQAITAAMHELTTAANKIVAGAIQPAISGFTRAAEALRPNLAPLAKEVNEQLQKAMASWDEEIKRQWVAAIPNWTDILRDKYSQEFADLAEKIAELARLQMEEPFSRREVEARVLAVAQSKKGHLTLSALATDWRLNHFPRQTIQEAVDMLVLRGQLRPVTLKVDTGDPARPYALLSAYALVREDEQIAADEIDL